MVVKHFISALGLVKDPSASKDVLWRLIPCLSLRKRPVVPWLLLHLQFLCSYVLKSFVESSWDPELCLKIDKMCMSACIILYWVYEWVYYLTLGYQTRGFVSSRCLQFRHEHAVLTFLVTQTHTHKSLNACFFPSRNTYCTYTQLESPVHTHPLPHLHTLSLEPQWGRVEALS